jgi:hypothetical protein
MEDKYCENAYITESNLQIQYNQNYNDIPHRNRKKKKLLKFIRKYKRPQTAEAILSKKNNARGITI